MYLYSYSITCIFTVEVEFVEKTDERTFIPLQHVQEVTVGNHGDVITTLSSSDDSDDDTSGDKRNLSNLEALFQAAHSELENISKERVPGSNAPQGVKKQILKRVSTDEERMKMGEVVAYLEVPDEMEKGTYVLKVCHIQ